MPTVVRFSKTFQWWSEHFLWGKNAFEEEENSVVRHSKYFCVVALHLAVVGTQLGLSSSEAHKFCFNLTTP